MDVKFSPFFYASAGATQHTVVTWVERHYDGPAPLSLAAFKSLSAEEQNSTCAEVVNAAIVTIGSDGRLPVDVYCAGGCHTLLYAAGTLEADALHRSPALRTTSYLWDLARSRMRGEVLIAVHCHAEGCIMALRTYFRDHNRRLRTEHPEAVTRRHCVVCHMSDTVENPFKRCARCHVPVYCSSACQKADWAKHKTVCTNI